ncbi:MAG: malectin domain-containing carbohydrate-binding protein [Armatimonadota bacterium]|nr:malectin domain-containing carbohydrate-binding protein [Armatimonadota bacterium]
MVKRPTNRSSPQARAILSLTFGARILPLGAILVSAAAILAAVSCKAAPNPPPGPEPSAAQPLPPSIPLNSGWTLQDTRRLAETGPEISSRSYQPGYWYGATVPGTVLTSLVNDGVYPEPLYGENNRPDKIPESLCRTSYWYRTRFAVPRSYAGRHAWLHFNGINYIAQVWVNGHHLGSIQGAFARGLFDISRYVSIGKGNTLAVQIFPPPHPGTPIEQTIQNGVGKNGGEPVRDGPTFSCTIGWDWIPGIRDRDMGIWQDVSVSASGPVLLQDPLIASDLPLPRIDSADLTVKTTLRNVTDQPQTGTLVGSFDQKTFRQPVTLAPGETQTLSFGPDTVPDLHVLNPRLWWPNGYGPHNLYTMHLSFIENGAVSDAQDVSFGIRKITYFLPGSDNLALSVNGVPIMCKGGDWGMDEAMKRIPRQRLEAQVHLHQLANYTMIRNWVGQSTSEDLYDLCDRYGILVWDEFFQPNPGDGPNPDDTELYLANVREKLLRFRNHPSIALWCARNEGDPPPTIDEGIRKLIAELEPYRLYQKNSAAGHGVQSSGPYHWRTPREFYDFGDAFKTEIGAPSIPTLEAVHAMMPPKDWENVNDDWAEHDFARGAQGGDSYPGVIGTRYGGISELADFVRKSQLANYECFRAMYEGHNAKLFHPATGIITWMSNPAQPSFVWQLYSHDLEPNASLFATRKACEPIHIQMSQKDWHLMIINNTPEQLEGLRAKVSIFNLDGAVQSIHTATVTAEGSAATDLGEIAFPDTVSAVHFVKLELTGAANQLLSENFYWRAVPEHQDSFEALNTLPTVTLQTDITRHDAADRCLLDVTLHNPTNSIALMTHLQLRRSESGDRVLPVYYSDNYVSLLPDETRTISVDAASEDLGGSDPLLVVDGWNVTVRPRTFNTSGKCSIAPNTAAAVNTATRSSVNINCGGGWTGGYSSDMDVEGGNTSSKNDAITTNVRYAAPASIYQSERWGACTYTLPIRTLPSAHAYTVRLHFAEITYDAPGARRFNVDINGQRVLSEYDVFAAAGGKDRAVVRDFTNIHPDGAGHIVISFTKGSADEPKISGIQVFASR